MDDKVYIIIGVIALVIAVGCIGYYLYRNKKEVQVYLAELEKLFNSDEFKRQVRAVMAKAEEIIVGTARGQERLKYVCGVINSMLPIWLQPFVTSDRLERFVNALFKEFSVVENGHSVVKD